jgi:glycosyltransferase involved in cell wall biosynthesis
MNINYISNQDLSFTSGGWSGINANLYQQLSSHLNINYIGPINPQSNIFEKILSKGLRTLGLKGNFHFFSDSRLIHINKLINSQLKSSSYNFFFGQTPWVRCNYNTPYGTYMDASFLTYIEIYSQPTAFTNKDLLRIAKLEESWLQKAKHIFIGSQWAWNEMLKHYDLDEKKKIVVHTGGNIEMPSQDCFDGQSLNFIFISLDFEKKGGFVCVEAFKVIKSKYPQASLTIIGQKPPEYVLNIDNVSYAGFLRKNVPEELNKFTKILSNAFMLIHPTTMDTMGAVLIEAGYFGCPSIAPKSFGIPELVLNNETGIIVNTLSDRDYFSRRILEIIENKEKYLSMRKNSWNYTRNNLAWEAICGKIYSNIIK